MPGTKTTRRPVLPGLVVLWLLLLACVSCGPAKSAGDVTAQPDTPSWNFGHEDTEQMDTGPDLKTPDDAVDTRQDTAEDGQEQPRDLDEDETEQCVPFCPPMSCGGNGCGSKCGDCNGEPAQCVNGWCKTCQPACLGSECGPDGCGGSCGDCTGDQVQCIAGKCRCVPACKDRECGPDGCEGTCGTCEGTQSVCSGGKCHCIPNCTGKACGSDGCGGLCGTCPGFQEQCVAGTCKCMGDCIGKDCGTDGCGGICGTCNVEDKCIAGRCTCTPDCTGKVCGSDGCGGFCGFCPGAQDECVNGACKCTPKCDGKLCGSNGCNGTCGTCGTGGTCDENFLCRYTGKAGIVWVSIPGGTYMMGCSEGDQGCGNDETPAHQVTVAPFEMMEAEGTEGQFKALNGSSPGSPLMGDQYPASWVRGKPLSGSTSYDSANTFCANAGGRVPTEAEWEWAARGGTKTKYSCGDDSSCVDSIAWYGANSGNARHKVKTKSPNGYGLYDMFGNVWEWTQDCWHNGYTGAPANGSAWTSACTTATSSVIRGASYDIALAGYLRVSYRGPLETIRRAVNSGVRCVRAPH